MICLMVFVFFLHFKNSVCLYCLSVRWRDNATFRVKTRKLTPASHYPVGFNLFSTIAGLGNLFLASQGRASDAQREAASVPGAPGARSRC